MMMSSAPFLPIGKLPRYLSDLQAVGRVRCVVQGAGAILESEGKFENLRYSLTPTKMPLATVSLDAPVAFECHIKLDKVAKVNQVVVEKFGKTLRIARMIDKDGSTLLSIIVSGGPEGEAKFDQLRERYGDSFENNDLDVETAA